jgi:outer membrane protein assembly factor BamD (BamD/ComL family)
MQENPVQDESNIIDGPPLWAVRYKGPIIASVLIVLAVIIGFASWKVRGNVRETQAVAALQSAITVDSQLQAARQFLGTDAAAVALLEAASAQYAKKDFDGAVGTYQLFLSNYKKHPLSNAALLGQAWAFEASGKADAALSNFSAVGLHLPADNYNPVGLIESARIYRDRKDYSAARQALTDCVRAYGNTSYGAQANELLKELPQS